MNGINLNRFQFEYDLTWMAFFQDGFGNNYARYGGREDSSPDSHMTKASLLKTMTTVLKLHQSNSVLAESKYEPRVDRVTTPEEIPAMTKMMARRKESCIHCHDVKNAKLKDLYQSGNLEKSMIYTYPSPRNLGLIIDSDDQSLIKAILPDSAAAFADLRAGDRISKMENQRVLTFADMTRILHLMPEHGKLRLQVNRSGISRSATLNLHQRWKQSSDPKWRASTGVVGPNSGFWAKTLNLQQRKKLELKEQDFGLQVVVVWGQWARKAGIRNGDIVVGLEGMNKSQGAGVVIRDLQTYLQLNRDYGDTVQLELIRGRKRIPVQVKLPAGPSD